MSKKLKTRIFGFKIALICGWNHTQKVVQVKFTVLPEVDYSNNSDSTETWNSSGSCILLLFYLVFRRLPFENVCIRIYLRIQNKKSSCSKFFKHVAHPEWIFHWFGFISNLLYLQFTYIVGWKLCQKESESTTKKFTIKQRYSKSYRMGFQQTMHTQFN